MNSSSLRSRLFACALLSVISGCGGSRESNSSLPTSVGPQDPTKLLSDLARSGIAPAYSGLRRLYVSDDGALGGPKPRIDILTNKTYKYIGKISKGIGFTPGGNFLDEQGNFYVADQDAADVKEYAPGAKLPTFRYNAGMISPEDVTVDTSGNVYEADSPDESNSFVNEYSQRSNTIIHTCETGFQEATGVAVDQKGDVFVDVQSQLIEFIGGLSGCAPRLLVSINNDGGGMALDKNDDIIVCDGANATVDVVAPPYQRITRTLAGPYGIPPISVRINKANTRVFVSDPGNVDGYPGAVFVLEYPSGNQITVLGKSNGIYSPFSAVDGPNAVY